MPHGVYNNRSKIILGYASTHLSTDFYIFKTKRWMELLTKLGNPRHPGRNGLTAISMCNIDCSRRKQIRLK